MSDLPEGWIETSLAEVIDTANTGLDAIKRAPIVLEDTGIKCFRIQDASQTKSYDKWGFTNVNSKNYAKFKLLEGDILIARTGNSIGVNFLVQKNTKSVFNNGLIRLRTNNKIRYDFLYKIISSKLFQRYIQSIAYGTSTQPNMQINVLLSYDLLLPPLPEQKAIANILTAFDKKIALLQAQNQTIETLAQTVFKEWFVDSDDPITLITDIIEFNPIEKIDRSREYLFFDMKSLSTDSMAMSDGIFKQSNSGTNFREEDTLFSKITPCLENGKTAFVLDLKGEKIARGSTEFIVMRAKENGSPYLNYCLARYTVFRDYAIKSMIGTSGRQRVPIERIKNFKIKHSLNSSIKFHNIIKPFFKKIKNNSKQINSLKNGRDTLLPKLMSGKVRLKNG